MDIVNSVLDLLAPPACCLAVAFAWPTLSFINACLCVYNSCYSQKYMFNRVVLITGASSPLGEQIAYEYAKRGANLVLVSRRDTRLRRISENARLIGANHVMIIAADVVKEDECRRFINKTIDFYGRVDHLVNATSLGHEFFFEEVTDTSVFPHLLDIIFWGNVYPTFVALPHLHRSNGRIIVNASVENWLPLPGMSLYSAAMAALLNFYETLRLELKDDVGITIATHGWAGIDVSRGKFTVVEGAEVQWREERQVHGTYRHVEEFARMIVSGACRGDSYVKSPRWYDIFYLFRVFAPDVLQWTFHLLLAPNGIAPRRPPLQGFERPYNYMRRPSLEGSYKLYSTEGTQRPALEGSERSYATQGTRRPALEGSERSYATQGTRRTSLEGSERSNSTQGTRRTALEGSERTNSRQGTQRPALEGSERPNSEGRVLLKLPSGPLTFSQHLLKLE